MAWREVMGGGISSGINMILVIGVGVERSSSKRTQRNKTGARTGGLHEREDAFKKSS